MVCNDNCFAKIRLNISVAGRPGCVDVLVNVVTGLVSLADASPEILTVVLPLVMDELLRNAVEHGNCSDPFKNIALNAALDRDVLMLEVQDEGNGFDYETVLAEVPPPALTGSGRGLQLVRHYCESMEFENGGRKVRVYLKIV